MVVKKRRDLPPAIQKLIPPKATTREVIQAEQLYATGITDGMVMSHGELLAMLEKKYLDQDAPKRGTPEAIAILELAKEIGNHLREKMEQSQSADKS